MRPGRNFSPLAAADLDRAAVWFLDHGGTPSGAGKLVETTLEAGRRLAARPLLGRHRLDLLPAPYRFWSIPRHRPLLVYRPHHGAAMFLRVLNTAQDLPPLLAELRDLPDG